MQPKLQIIVLSIALLLLVSSSYINAQVWTPPTVNPTGGNTLTPINTGVVAGSQTMDGGLGLDFMVVGGTASANSVRATEFCDPTGMSCISGATLVSSAGGSFSSNVEAVNYCDETGANCFTAAEITSLKAATNPFDGCSLEYRFRRNAAAAPWRSLLLDGNNHLGSWSTWSVSNLNDECAGAGCGIQLRITGCN